MSRPAGGFEIRVHPRPRGEYGLGLYRPSPGPNGGSECVARIHGDPLRAAIEPVLAALRHAGHRPTDLRPTHREPFPIAEEDAVRLGLLFLALQPLRKPARMEEAVERIRAMAPEEVYYWFSKATAPADGPRARRALRTLIAQE